MDCAWPACALLASVKRGRSHGKSRAGSYGLVPSGRRAAQIQKSRVSTNEQERDKWMKYSLCFGWILILAAFSFSEDEKLKDKIFVSRNNQIQTLQSSTLSNTKYLVLRLKKKLDGKNSRGKGYDEKSNYGDSASTYCYKKESDLSELEKTMISEWFTSNGSISIQYTCGELQDEEKRKTFLGFAETNCQCLDITFENMNKVKSPWR